MKHKELLNNNEAAVYEDGFQIMTYTDRNLSPTRETDAC
jgi:hypothetical protein